MLPKINHKTSQALNVAQMLLFRLHLLFPETIPKVGKNEMKQVLKVRATIRMLRVAVFSFFAQKIRE